MPKITSLTAAQRARFPEFIDKWIKIGLSTQPADRERSERGIKGLYALAKLREPSVIWLPCPLSAALAAAIYAMAVSLRRELTAKSSVDNNKIGASLTGGAFSAPTKLSVAIDTAVGTAVRTAVRTAVGTAVDTAVGTAVDTAVRAAWWWFGGSLWAGYSAWADYMNEILGVSIDRNYLDLTESCGFYWTLDGVCFASERPKYINLDDRDRLHCEIGQSIGYPSGWGLWHWHGVRVPESVIAAPTAVTVDKIDAEQNVEIRRVMIDRYRLGDETHGAAAYLRDAGGKRLDHDDNFGTLWRRDVANDEPIVMVEVVNSTREPDGSWKRYFLRVPPGTKTSHEAVAWTFGMTPADYRPRVET